MKIRYGFVSNSSSSSFTCDVCGNTESGYDACPEDLGFVCCHNGHTFCVGDRLNSEYTDDEKRNFLIGGISPHWKDEERVKKIEEIKVATGDRLDDFWSDYVCDGVPPRECPICSMKKVSHNDRYRYLLKLAGKSPQEIDVEIQIRFPDYDAFKDFVYQKK